MISKVLVVCLAVAFMAGCGRAPVLPAMGLRVLTPVIELVGTDDGASACQTATIRVKNVGTAPVSITGINFGCSCVELLSASDQPIAVGDIVEIQLKAHLPASGEQVVRVTMTTTPTSEGPLLVELKLRGNSISLPQMSAPFADVRFAIPSNGTDSKDVSIQIWEKTGSTPCLRGFTIDSPRCRVTIPEPPVELKINDEIVARTYRVQIEADGGPELLQTVTVVPTLDPLVPGLEPFRVTIECPPLIRVTPTVLNVSTASLPVKRQVLLSCSTSDWTCKQGEGWPEWVTVSSAEKIDSPTERTYRMTLQFDRPPSPHASRATLSFLVSGTDTTSVVVPIHLD